LGNPPLANWRPVARQGGVADLPEDREVDQVIGPELFPPLRKFAAQALGNSFTAIELDPMALAIIEPDRLDRRKPGERPGEAGRRILPPGKQHERRLGLNDLAHRHDIGARHAAINKAS
jgi:hypothetical protein